jgi:uncharacterized membrane protein HdeD (DUF308 family)
MKETTMSGDLSFAVVQKHSKWSLIASLVIFVCGILAVVLPLTFSFGMAIIIGSVVLVAGIAHLVFAFHARDIGGFLWHIFLCALYEMAAICLLVNPLLSLFSLVLLLAILLLLEGVLQLGLYVDLRRLRHSIWLFIDGVGTLILGILIARQWPPASLEIIGALIGISLMLTAVSRTILWVTVRRLDPVAAG